MIKTPAKRVYQQGELDGLCGVYSLINAYNFLVPNSSKAKSAELFYTLIKSIPKKKWQSYIYQGLECRDLKRALGGINDLRGFLYYKKNDTVSLEDLWGKFQEFLNQRERSCILISLRGKHDHWTVVYAASDSTLYLLDSVGLRSLRKAWCYTCKGEQKTHLIVAHQCFFITRHDN